MMRKKLPKLISVVVILILIACTGCYGYLYLTRTYEVTTVYVDGNSHYSDDEIKDMIMTGRFGHNSLYLSRKYKNKAIEDVPFVETMDVSILSPDTIQIQVYEKALAGYIEYLGRYVYFDKDGIVVEVSGKKTKGIPEVLGVDFDYVVLYEPLPVEDNSLFKNVLNLTQLMEKYEVFAEKVYFKPGGEIILYHEDIDIYLGSDTDLDVKIMNLKPILKNLVGRSGTLRMENYSESNPKAGFEPDSDDPSKNQEKEEGDGD
jgi:cell division protein FtsQ